MNEQKGVFKNLYKNLMNPILKNDSGIDAEYLTNLSLSLLSFSSRKQNWPLVSSILKNLNEEFSVIDKRLSQNICGINFCNPIGLAAGFDKNGNAANIWKDFGFGFAELGTVTKFAQNGNPKPRLFRLAEEEAALNRMGFNNNGAENLVKNFLEQGIEFKKNRENICLGINFGKSKITSLSQAKDDYLTSLKLLIPYCDYAAINVSSPNTEGLRKLQDPILLKELLKEKYKMVLDENRSLIAIQGPKSSEILNDVINGVKDLNFMSGNWFTFENQKVYITRSGYTGEDGFEISIANDFVDQLTRELINKGSKLIGLGARDTLRLEAGLCLYGHDLDKDKTPVEANLKWAISKERISKGDFIGSDIIIKQLNDGVSKIRVGIKPEGRIIAREKTKIFNQSDVHIGEITSGTFGPSVNGPVAMGYVENEFSKKNTKVFLEVRGKKHPASICSLPFYKKSYVKGVN